MLLLFKNQGKNKGQPRFSRGELSLLLGLYGARVKSGEWRDYAIDSLPEMAVFSVYKSARENPVYAIAKIPSRSILKPSVFTLFQGEKALVESASLNEVINYFAEEE